MKLNKLSKSSLYAYDCDMLILALVLAFVNCAKNKRITILKLFIMVPTVLGNISKDAYNVKKELSMFVSKAENSDMNQSNFQLKSNDLIMMRKEQIYEAIKLGLHVGLFDLVFENDLYLVQKINIKKDDIKQYKDEIMVKNIRRLSTIFGNSEIVDILRMFKMGE